MGESYQIDVNGSGMKHDAKNAHGALPNAIVKSPATYVRFSSGLFKHARVRNWCGRESFAHNKRRHLLHKAGNLLAMRMAVVGRHMFSRGKCPFASRRSFSRSLSHFRITLSTAEIYANNRSVNSGEVRSPPKPSGEGEAHSATAGECAWGIVYCPDPKRQIRRDTIQVALRDFSTRCAPRGTG